MFSDRLFHACDTVVATVGTVITTASAALLATVRPYNAEDQLWQTLLPLIGVTLFVFGTVLLNPQTETRRIVMGRAVIGGFFGMIAPSLAIAVGPNILPEWALWVVDVLRWPMVLIGFAGVVAGIGYLLSRPFFARAYERADAIAKAQVERLVDMAKGPNNTVIVVEPKILADTDKPRTP